MANESIKENSWLKQLLQNETLWYHDDKNIYPALIHRQYDHLHILAAQGELYGFFLQLRDIFEALIRWYDLTCFAFAAYMQDMDAVSLLCDPEHAYSFGDWVQIPPTKLNQSPYIKKTSIGKLLANLNRQYNKMKIVFWRNESIGHGALQPDTSQEFINTLETQFSNLTLLLSTTEPLAKNIIYQDQPSNLYSCSIDGGPFFRLDPFIRKVADDYSLFDSLHRGNNTGKMLSYQTGKRISADMSYFHQISSRYYGSTPITAVGSFDDSVFSGKLETALQHFHSTGQYWDQAHYFQWLSDSMAKHNCGVFLLQSDSGTGKSVFADRLDGMGKQALYKQGIICRVYHFSRLSFRTSKEFSFALGDLFRSVPEYEDELRGQLPSLNYQLPLEQRGKAMAEFLQIFHNLYNANYGNSKLLLVLDGIDQLAPEDTHLLNFVPTPDSLPDGVYFLITCCPSALQGSFQQDFLDSFSFSEAVYFPKDGENAELLKKAISESITLSGQALDREQVDEIGQIVDFRFTALPVIRALLEHIDSFEAVRDIPSLLSAYIGLLKQLYGIHHFPALRSVLLTLALSMEPLSIRLISQLAFGCPPTAELLAIMRDLSPLLISTNQKSQTRYMLGHPDFGGLLQINYAEECKELVLNWKLEISGTLDFPNLEYDSSTYIASGIIFWSNDVLKEQVMDLSLLENMDRIAEFFSQSRNTVPHIARTIRILASAQNALTKYWHETQNISAAIEAIHSLAVIIPKLVLMECTAECLYADELSEKLIKELPQNTMERPDVIRALFFNYENRSTLMSKLGNLEKCTAYEEAAWELVEHYPQHIPNFHQIPFIYNRAVDLVHTNPEAAIAICDTIFSFPESTPFHKARSLLVKSDALKEMDQQNQAGECIRQAVHLIENVPPQNRVDAQTYLNALRHLGNHLCHIEEDFEAAISTFEKLLSIFEQSNKANQLSDRFEAAQVLSEIGGAYYGLDTKLCGCEHKEDALWHMQQSIQVFRTAIEKGIGFQPASAEAPYVNAAYAYDYYGLKSEAIALIQELEQMQNDDIYGRPVINRCKNILVELQ